LTLSHHLQSFVDLGQTLKNHRLTEGDEVAGARGAVLLLSFFQSTVQLQFFINLWEGALGSSDAGLFKERVWHRRFPFIGHQGHMGAAICDIVLGEADARHNFIGDHNECYNFNWDLKVGLEVLVELMVCLVFIFSNIVDSNMEVVNFFPAIDFLFAL
jgi:hypothetical protein